MTPKPTVRETHLAWVAALEASGELWANNGSVIENPKPGEHGIAGKYDGRHVTYDTSGIEVPLYVDDLSTTATVGNEP